MSQSSKASGFWIDPISLDKIITYIYMIFSPSKNIIIFNENIIPTVSGTIFLIFSIYLIYKYYKESSYATNGFEIFALFMFLGIAISIIINPLFHPRYMIPILGVFWLSFSILFSKSFADKKLFYPMQILILIIGVMGTGYFIDSQNNDAIETNDLTAQFNNVLSSGNIIFFDEPIPYLKISQYYLDENNTYILIDSDNVSSEIEKRLNDPEIQNKIKLGAKVYYVDAYDSNLNQFNDTPIKLTKISTIIKYDIYQIEG